MFRRVFSLIRLPIILVACGVLAPPLHAASTDEPAELVASQQHHDRLWVSIEFVLQQQDDKRELVLVDVGPREEYQRIRIPGSINIPLFALRTKTFLKSKPVVLIHKGSSPHRLEEECRRLRDGGFLRVCALHGGLAAWIQKGGPIQGDVFSRKELSRVSPQDAFLERDKEGWIVVDVSESNGPDSRRLIPEVATVPYRDNQEEFLAGFKEILGREDGNPFRLILICNQTGEYPEKMERVIREAATYPVFYLEGGLVAYDKFLKQNVLIQKSKESRKIVKKCATCP
jgi:rhodanese-related sulfurtransferase